MAVFGSEAAPVHLDLPPVPENVCDLLQWELDKAAAAIEYINERTAQDPYFAVLTAALNGAPVDFNMQQPFIERALACMKDKDWCPDRPITHQVDLNDKVVPLPGHEVKRSLRKTGLVLKRDYRRPEVPSLEDPGVAEVVIEGSQLWKSRANTVRDTTRIYNEVCEDPQYCRTPTGREELVQRIEEEAHGINQKTADLLREYLGDEDAVAVDRHVWRWLNNQGGAPHPQEQARTMPSKTDYFFLSEVLRNIAKTCGREPVHQQVAAWLKGACDAKPTDTILLGEGHTIFCAERNVHPLSRFIEE